MENKQYLNEEKYQKTSKKLFTIGIGIIIFGIIVAIVTAVIRLKPETKISTEELQQQLTNLRPDLEDRYAELGAEGFTESYDYKNKEGYEMRLIDIALDPTYETCESSSVYSDNDTTREYCEIKAQLHEVNYSNKYSISEPIMLKLGPSLMILLSCIAFGLMFIMISKQREIAAYTAQSGMPLAQEGLEKMSPSIGKAAKEIAKGVKEGLKDTDEK